MQAFEIVYNPGEDRVVLGWPGGKVAIHEVEADGSPGEIVTEIIHHKSTIVCLAYAGDRLVTVSDDGAWAVSDSTSGDVALRGSVGGEYVAASLSPGGASLFLFTHLDGDARVFRVSCSDGSQLEGPDIDDEVSVTSRVFALTDDVALYHVIEDDSDTDETVEGFVTVDFAAQTYSKALFRAGPTSDFDSDRRLMAIDPVRRIGIRPDYQPVELVTVDDAPRAVLRAEIFDVDTLETKARPVVLRWPTEHLGHTAADLATAEPGSAEFVEAQDWYVRWLCSARFVSGSEHVWVSIQRGIVRRLALDGEGSDAPIIHGGGPGGTGFTLDDVFARNLVNNYTLGVSASGRFVGFGNPNDHFCIDDVDLGSKLAVKLPKRAATGPTTEAPGRIDFAGDRLIVFDRANRMFIADGATGAPSKTIELPEHYGDATRAVMSPDGKRLAVSVSGGEAFFYDTEADEILGLPIPPHSIHADFTSNRRLYMVHHNGAVVAVDFELEDVKAHRANDEGYPEEMLEGMDPEEVAYMKQMEVFEQRYDCYAGVVYRDQDADWVGVIDENDDLQLYKVSGESLVIEDGPSIDVAGHRLAAGDGWIAVAADNELRIVDPSKPGVVRTLTFDGELRAMHTGEGGALYVFDDRTGQLHRLADPRTGDPELAFQYEGPSIARLVLSETLDRLALVTASGEIELRELGSGVGVATLRIEPDGDDARVLICE